MRKEGYKFQTNFRFNFDHTINFYTTNSWGLERIGTLLQDISGEVFPNRSNGNHRYGW